VSECDVFKRLRLASSEKQVPQVIENTEKGKRQMGFLEPEAALRRQTLYPLSYGRPFDSKRFGDHTTR
jgi:hypothetical protein